MNKRQLKKRNKKHIPVIGDEFNLLTMTDKEREESYKEYEEFVRRYTYRKKYKNLKKRALFYYYPVGEIESASVDELSSKCRKSTGKDSASKHTIATQNFCDFLTGDIK